MKKNILINISLLSIAIFVLIISFIRIKSYKKEVKNAHLELSLYRTNSSLNRKYATLDEGSKAPDSLFVIYNGNNEDRTSSILSNCLNDKPTLVLRISDRYCESCIMSAISLIDTVKRDHPELRNHVILLASYSSLRLLNIWKSSHHISMPSFLIAHKEQILRSDALELPYIFVLLPHGKVTSLFIPFKEIPKLTLEYLRAITHKYFNNTGLANGI